MAQITEANTVVVVVVVAVAESVDLCFLAHPSLLGLIVVVKGNSVMHHAEYTSVTLKCLTIKVMASFRFRRCMIFVVIAQHASLPIYYSAFLVHQLFFVEQVKLPWSS